MTSPSAAPRSDITAVSDKSAGLPYQLFRALGFLVLLLMVVSCAYAAFIIIQNWSDISV